MDEVRSTESAFTSSYPTRVSGIVLFKYQTLDENIWSFIFYRLEFLAILRKDFSVIKLSVSIFEQTTGNMNCTVSRKPIRLPEIQYPVFDI